MKSQINGYYCYTLHRPCLNGQAELKSSKSSALWALKLQIWICSVEGALSSTAHKWASGGPVGHGGQRKKNNVKVDGTMLVTQKGDCH